MPTKSTTSKSTKRSAPSPTEGAPSSAHDEAKTIKPVKVLSLIDEPEVVKKKRGAPAVGSGLTPFGAKPSIKKPVAPPVPAAPEPPKKTLDQHKAEALNLFDEEEQKAAKKAVRRSEPEVSPIIPFGVVRPPVVKPKIEPEPVQVAPEVKVEVVADSANEDETGDPKVIHIKPPIIVKDLADRLGLRPFQVIKDLLALKIFTTPDKAIEPDIAAKICETHGFTFEKEKRKEGGGVHKIEEVIEPPPAPKLEEQPKDVLELRAPIITFMGHVDHGKTSLLDAIRKTNVTTGEAGGITQHIGAYSVTHNGHPITFIDTPGHAAFSEMRARGAHVTDIVVLVIASDDGIMPQTVEAMNHAKAAGVTIMIAINKCDLPAANIMRVKQQLQGADLMPVEWGGDTEVMEVSAKTGLGLDNLLETMSLQAEVLELKANPKAPARATIIESRMDPGRGPTATVIVQTGTLKIGQAFICGPYSGKVKSMNNDRGQIIKEVRPGMPAEVIGFSGMPNVGDEVVVLDNERSAKKLSEERQEELRQKKLAVPRRSSLETLFNNLRDGERKALKLVLKTDVQGSLEAITKMLMEIKSEKVNVEILHSAAGPIGEGDVLLASASDAIVIGFNVKVENTAVSVAKREGVQVKLFSIIYELVDQMKEAMLGLLDPLLREKVIGHARVKQVFKLSRGTVAGCVVTDGKIDRKARARVIRGTQPVYDGSVETLKRFTEDVGEVRNGLECGIRLGSYREYEEDDVIECYELEKIAQAL